MTILDYFDAYSKAGLQAIPLYEGSKVPVGRKWNAGWDRLWCRDYFAGRPSSNIGLLLGKYIDVEGDTPEANALLDDLLRGHPHPMYRSSKSVHHLFLNPDPGLTSIRYDGIEFRAHRHQSVIPPSVHEDGTKYEWVYGSKFPIPPMPPTLLALYNERRRATPKARRTGIKPGHTQTRCHCCGAAVFIHLKRLALEVKAFAEVGLPWACRTCRTVDVRPACRRLRQYPSRKARNTPARPMSWLASA